MPLLKLVGLIFALMPAVAHAEASDKEPVTGLFWIVGTVAAFSCLLSARFKPWLGLLLFASATLWFISLFMELHSTDVGPYLRLEQGAIYYFQAYASFVLVVSGLLAGLVWHRKKRR